MSTDSKLYPGMVLGRYELLLPIAQGGMATVWAARQKGSRGFTKTVAIKTMLPGLSDDPQFEEMFLDERGWRRRSSTRTSLRSSTSVRKTRSSIS